MIPPSWRNMQGIFSKFSLFKKLVDMDGHFLLEFTIAVVVVSFKMMGIVMMTIIVTSPLALNSGVVVAKYPKHNLTV